MEGFEYFEKYTPPLSLYPSADYWAVMVVPMFAPDMLMDCLQVYLPALRSLRKHYVAVGFVHMGDQGAGSSASTALG